MDLVSSLILRVRAYTGFTEEDISDEFVQIFLEDAMSVIYDETTIEIEPELNLHSRLMILYACGAATVYVNGPEVRKLEVGDTKITFGSPKSGIASNQFFEQFWDLIIDLSPSGGVTKSTWDLSTFYPPDYKKDMKGYKRIQRRR